MAAVSGRYLFVWPLLWFCVRLSETSNTGVSLGDDVLQPYAVGHGPAHSHRHVRDCQAAVHGNLTHESLSPPAGRGGLPPAESTMFVSDVPRSSRRVYGHVTVVRDPLRTLSVLEPGGPGGCEAKRRATVEQTAAGAGCLYAQNAGFFDTASHRCLGNVVSDGRRVRDSGGVQNAQFGIRRDGSLVFGYLSQEDVLDRSNPFVQLVSGVVWLLRNKEVYINQSLQAECDETQETGQFRNFVDVVSARTAVGHNAEGDLILFHIDGQTGVRGMNLWEVAEALKGYRVVNAINLDGGGSSTYVTHGSLASYPSDHCESDSRWRCARPVSTILCVHQPRCRPGDCGVRRVCTANGCICDAGWRGEDCSLECLPGFYGDGCNQTCNCVNGGACDPVRGRCACTPGFHGNTCEQVCPLGFFGPSCANECRCDNECPCDPQTGSCNATLRGESNRTLHTAGRCLAKQMFIRWRRDEEAHGPRLTERTWLTVTCTLASLLLASLLLHLLRGCGGAAPAAARPPGRRRDYSYVPLVSVNGAAQDDVDSEEAVWSPGTSLGKSAMRREGQMFADHTLRHERPDLRQQEQNSGGSGSAELVNHQEPCKDFPPHAPSNETHLVAL